MMRSPLRGSRQGLSLLEVLVSLAIFLFSLILISKLVLLGGDLALEVQAQAQATQMCQSKLAEVVAGAVPLGGQTEVPFEEDPGWSWSMECSESNVPGLWQVTVRISREREMGMHVECALSRLVLDPSLRGSSMDAATTATTGTDATSQSGSSSSSQSGSSGSGSTGSGAGGSGSTGSGGGSGGGGGGGGGTGGAGGGGAGNTKGGR